MNILSVTVTYHPDLAALRRQLDRLLDSAAHAGAAGAPPFALQALVVDNGSDEATQKTLRGWTAVNARLALLELGENLGLAAAHNRGIVNARSRGCSHVLLMDQDSLPDPDMVAQLTAAWTALAAPGPEAAQPLAAVGPRYTDPVLGNPPDFVQLRPWGLFRHKPDPARPRVPVDYLISSGCLISLAALQAVGPMDEALFIDYVDIEWGLRANGLGWHLYGVFPAHMTHALGPRVMRLLWRRFPMHSPQRHYFVVRNALWLYRQSRLPWRWRLPHGLRLAVRMSFYLLLGDQRRKRLCYVWQGIKDGFAGRMGKPPWMA